MNTELQYQFNKQINAEIYSAYLYLAMAAAAAAKGSKGASHWLTRQYYEEMGHAMKLIVYMNDRSAAVRFYTVDAPPEEFGSVAETFQKVLEHEQHVTALIGALAREAEYAADQDARNFLQWYIDEQVEEEETAGKILASYISAGEDAEALAAIEGQLASRN